MSANFQFFYTGGQGIQSDSSKSLGGYISTSLVGNQVNGNIWGDISQLTKATNKSEYRVIAIKNVGDTIATNLTLQINYPRSDDASDSDNQIDFINILSGFIKVGYAIPAPDQCGDLFSETLPTIYSKPLSIALTDASVQPLQLPNIAVGGYVCIYMQRTLNPTFLQALSTKDLVDIMNRTVTLDTVEDILMLLHWTG